ncbi:MAG: Gfo/Idh/MocA family protein [Thermodesulfobacteriota bacterium]
MPKYKVGIIGCGGIGRDHARAYLEIPGIEVIAGAEVNPDNAKRFSEQFGVKRMYTDYGEMLEKEKLDLVSVCTWPRTHCDATVRAAQSGVKGIMCEKPMAVTLEEADRMIAACDRGGVVLAVGHQHRFDPQSVKARELIEQGAIGEPVLFWGHCSLDLMNNGSHVIDMLNYFNGDQPVEWVIGQIDRRHKKLGQANHPDMPVEDMGVGQIKYKNGLEATVELGEFALQEWQFHLFGSEGIIDVNLPGGPPVRLLSSKKKGWMVPQLKPVDVRVAEMRELVAAIEEGRAHLSSDRRGRAALEVAIAIFESSRRRALINFPVKVRDFPLETMIKEGMV